MSRFGAEVVLDRPAFIHETALIYGRVRIGEGASLWPYAVIRAESDLVEIGPVTNIQDHATVHIGCDPPTRISAWCPSTPTGLLPRGITRAHSPLANTAD